MRLIRLAIIVAIGLTLESCTARAPGGPRDDRAARDGRVAIVDAHVHPLRGLHRGGAGVSASALLQLMDEYAVEQMVLLPPPFPAASP
jgi:hypothetical protein